MKKMLLLCCACFLGRSCAAEGEVLNLDSGFYIGAGGCFTRMTDQADALWVVGTSVVPGKTIQNKKINKTGLTLAFGYGQSVMGRCYVGGEVSCDVSGNRSYSGVYNYNDSDDVMRYRGKNRGFVPSAVVRFGWCLTPATMAYVKAGGSYVKSEFHDGMGEALLSDFSSGSDVTISKIVPVVGFGIERKVSGNFGLRLEGDYRFNSKRISAEIVADQADVVVVGLRNRVKGCTVRLVGTYALKF